MPQPKQGSALNAQYGLATEVIEPQLSREIDLATLGTGDQVGGAIRTLQAAIEPSPSGQNFKKAWIPLGLYGSGTHSLSISLGGWDSRASLQCDFAVYYGSPSAKLVVHQLQKFTEGESNNVIARSDIELYAVPLNDNVQGYGRVALVLWFQHGVKDPHPTDSRTNYVNAVHRSSLYNNWAAWNGLVDNTALTSLTINDRLKGQIETRNGYKRNSENFLSGMPLTNIEGNLTVNGSPIFTGSPNNAGSSSSFLVEGTYLGNGSIPVQGSGARMMWYPEKAAFRAGYVPSSRWDDGNVGLRSTAFGYNTQASDSDAVAMGHGTRATASNSTSMGGLTLASGTNSTAMGLSTVASGYNATAMGGYTTASGQYSIAMGRNSQSQGSYSLAAGYSSIAHGETSTAMGGYNTATGKYSTAMGAYTEAKSRASFALGQYNEKRGSTAGEIAWQGDNQHSVLEVGIGTATTPSNALTVLQDGSVELGKATDNTVPLTVNANGDVTLSRAQGDISMGAFGN